MLFGSSAPKFIFDPTGVNEEVLLDYAVVTKDEPKEDVIIHESKFTSYRVYNVKGKYWIFECKLHLYKYNSVDDGFTPKEKYEQIKSYEGKLGRLHRHSDGDYLKDSEGVGVNMVLEKVIPSYYKTTDYKDLLLLKFQSESYVDLFQGVI